MKRIPNKPGDNLAKLRKRAGLTLKDLAQRVGTNYQTIQKLEQSERGMTADWIFKLSHALNCAPGEILLGDERNGLVKAPLVSWVQAGRLTEVEDPYEIGTGEQFVYVNHHRDSVISLTVQGDSMNRVAPAGSQIVVDYDDKVLVDGGYYVIKMADEATFKKYRASPDRFEPESLSPHDTIFPTAPVVVVGRVVQVSRKL